MKGVPVLPIRWRERGEALERYAPSVAEVLVDCADELEDAVREDEDETLNLQEAARESGYTRDHLGRLVRERKTPNAGRPNSPRIRREDLPVGTGSHKRIRAPNEGELAAERLR